MIHMRKAQASQAALNQMQLGQKMSQMAQAQSQMPGVSSAGQVGDASAIGAPAQTIPAPLNQANLEENNRVLNKMQNRTNSKSGQTPAAPTTAQPPFSLHATSPHGQPAYIGKPAVTQETLHLPAAKRRKTGGQATAASPATTHTPVATTPSQTKVMSPDARRQHAADAAKAQAPSMALLQRPTKPLLYCTEADCDTKTTGFATEEARRAHIEEEHTKPNADPMKFVQDCLAEAFGLDADGKPKGTNASAVSAAAAASATMVASSSRQGPTPDTPMSRVASMNRQTSAASGVGKGAVGSGIAIGTSGKNGAREDVDVATLKASHNQMQSAADASLQNVVEDPWDSATVDPHELSNAFSFAADTVANGAIADFSVYLNSLTPNDTPESKADSGWSSEPTSDVSENVQIDNGLELFTVGDGTIMPSMLDSMPRFSMQPVDENDAADFAQMYLGEAPDIVPLDTDLTEMFSKSSIELDSSLYHFR